MRLSTYLDIKNEFKIHFSLIQPLIKLIFNKYYNFKFNNDNPLYKYLLNYYNYYPYEKDSLYNYYKDELKDFKTNNTNNYNSYI